MAGERVLERLAVGHKRPQEGRDQLQVQQVRRREVRADLCSTEEE